MLSLSVERYTYLIFVDCQKNPARQEELVAGLHLAEIIGAIGTLKNGGNFVLKCFTFFESDTLCQLYLLASIFRKLSVYKPATSKEGNSEVYLICEDFLGMEKSALNVLIENINHGGTNLFNKKDIPDEFKDQVKKCSRFFMDIQIKVVGIFVIKQPFLFNRKKISQLYLA